MPPAKKAATAAKKAAALIEGSPSEGCGAGYRHAQASRCRVGRQP
jgi:hypothetical protein